jgi:YVTN family beta-propeller protein
MPRIFSPLIAILLTALPLSAGQMHAAHLRRPIAVATAGNWIYTANRESGTVSVLNIENRAVVAERKVGRQLSDMVACPDNQHLIALDEAKGQLIVLRHDGESIVIEHRHTVPPYPVTVQVSPDGQWCSVASLWPRQLTWMRLDRLLNDLTIDDPLAKSSSKTFDLEFAPRNQCWLDARRLIVADSFGGRLAVFDVDRGKQLGQLKIDGHNIRGLTLNADKTELFIAHQLLNSQSATTHSRVFWGDVMGNVLRSVAVTHLHELLDESELGDPGRDGPEPDRQQAHQIAHWMFYPLGEPSNAAGDPGTILVNDQGKTLVLLSGTGEVAIRPGDRHVFSRQAVGRRPIAAALTSDQETAVVANYFDDSVSLISLATREILGTISLGAQPELTLAQQGEVLFYDAHLSLDKWYSCHSCHTDGHTNGLLNDNLGDDSYGAPKRVLSLLGVGTTGPWAWNGRQTDLHDQIAKSIRVTMQSQRTDEQLGRDKTALAAYLRTLKSPPAVTDVRGTIDAEAVGRGRAVFDTVGCVNCHQPGDYTTADAYDVGLEDEAGHSKFNPPSLLGISQRETFFHDGRATDLQDVMMSSEHGELSKSLDDRKLADLNAFLNSL